MGKYIPPTSKEIHAFGWGFMDGLTFKSQNYETRIKDAMNLLDDIKKEPHYYRLGYFITNRLKWVGGASLVCL